MIDFNNAAFVKLKQIDVNKLGKSLYDLLMPFAALPGYEEAKEKKRRLHEEKVKAEDGYVEIEE